MGETHTGAMIALVPSDADVERLAVPDGELADQLHLTIYYLGEAAAIPESERDRILDAVVSVARGSESVQADLFALSVFNPAGFVKSDDKDREPCVVGGIGDLNGQLTTLKTAIDEMLTGETAGFELPEQHSPWIPHVTLYYGDDAHERVAELVDRAGPVTFDALRVTFGDEIYDVPLDGEQSDRPTDEAFRFDPRQSRDNHPVGDTRDVDVDADNEIIVPNILLDLRDYVETFRREGRVELPGVGHNLRDYWIAGKGAAKIRWGTEGSMKRCIRHLREYVHDPGGLCATYHRMATGEWPRGGDVPSGEQDVEVFHAGETHEEDRPVSPQLYLATVIEPDESGNCPEGYVPLPDGRCVMITGNITEGMAGGAPTPSSVTYEIPETSEVDCPPGHHRMPNGECMPDDEMTELSDVDAGTATWEGVLTVEGVESGDGRMFLPNALTWGTPPLPMMWQKETAHGGEARNVSVRVGSITDIWREDDPGGRASVKIIRGRGVIDLGSSDGREVQRRMSRGFLESNSVDVDSVKDADVEMRYPEVSVVTDDDGSDDGDDGGVRTLFSPPELTVFRKGRVRGTTLVEFPAFVEATLGLTDTTSELISSDRVALGAVARHETSTTDGAWDGPESERRLQGPISLDVARDVYAWVDESQVTDGTVPKSACKLPHHDVTPDGAPGPANLTACSAAIAALNGARGGVRNMSPTDREGAYSHLASHLRDADREPPPLRVDEFTALTAATHLMRISDTPPRAWFDEPTDVIPRGALTVTDEGRVYGYLAPANVRHRSFGHKAVYTPLGKVDYSRFMGGETIVADGGRVTTGVITMNCGHATTEHNLTTTAAMEHYDNSCSLVANVRVGENRNGVWVAGALLPDVEPSQVRRIMGCRLSGDWRAHLDRPGWRELAAALLVPVPGFPMARSAPSVEMLDGQLVASSTPVRFIHTTTRRTRVAALRTRIEALHGQYSQSDHGDDDRLVRSARIASLRARVTSLDVTSNDNTGERK